MTIADITFIGQVRIIKLWGGQFSVETDKTIETVGSFEEAKQLAADINECEEGE